MEQNKEEVIKYFTNQYRKMLIENFEDYIKNFKSYKEKESKS